MDSRKNHKKLLHINISGVGSKRKMVMISKEILNKYLKGEIVFEKEIKSKPTRLKKHSDGNNAYIEKTNNIKKYI